MSTKEAQRAAHDAWRKRLKESGGTRFAVAFTAEGLTALDALTGGDNRKRSQAVNAALIAAAKAVQKPAGADVKAMVDDIRAKFPKTLARLREAEKAEERAKNANLKATVERMARAKAAKPKLDTSTVSIHPDLQKERK